MLVGLFIFLTLFSFSTFAQKVEDKEVKKIGLQEAFEIARRENPTYLQIKESLNQSVSSISLTKSSVFPVITATAAVQRKKDAEGVSGTISSGVAHDEYNAGLHLNQPLYTRGMLSAVDSAEKDYKITQLNSKIYERDLGTSVIQSYYQIVLNLRTFSALERQQAIVEESLKVTEHRKQIGRSQQLDVYQIRTQISLLRSQVVDAKNLIDVGKINFSNFLGAPKRPYEVEDKLSIPDFDEAMIKVSSYNILLPELEQNKIQILQIEDQRDILWGKNLPSLNLLGDYNFQTNHASELIREKSNSWDVGVFLTMPLFSGLSSSDERAILLSRKKQLEYSGKNVENQNSLQVVTSKKQLENALENVKAGIEALDYARQSSRESIKQYKNSTIDLLQFLTVQNSYVQAELALNNSKYNYIIALTNFYVSSGVSMDDLIAFLESSGTI